MKKPLPADIRAEVWLARQQHPNVVVRATGTFARPYSPDVLTVDDRTDEAVRYVDLSREGFYDMLPEALFHPPRPTNLAEAPAKRSKRLQQEEKAGRQFWLPAEQEMMRLRVRIEQQEELALTQSGGPVWQEVFDWLLDLRGYQLTSQQQICLLAIWLNAHRLVGNWAETAPYFSRFLGVPVRITHGPRQTTLPVGQPTGELPAGAVPRLGGARVGIDWVLPTTQPLADDGGVIYLSVGPLTPAQLLNFLPNQTGWRHIALLAGHLLPADADYVVVPLPDTETGWFTLAGNATASRLGMTTQLPEAAPLPL